MIERYSIDSLAPDMRFNRAHRTSIEFLTRLTRRVQGYRTKCRVAHSYISVLHWHDLLSAVHCFLKSEQTQLRSLIPDRGQLRPTELFARCVREESLRVSVSPSQSRTRRQPHFLSTISTIDCKRCLSLLSASLLLSSPSKSPIDFGSKSQH